jgi:hypothetical protein
LGEVADPAQLPALKFLMDFPGDVHVLKTIHACIVHVWSQVSARFKSYWQSLTADLRRDFIRTFAVELAQSVRLGSYLVGRSQIFFLFSSLTSNH